MDLFDRLCQTETLWEAWQKVRQKNARGGVDGVRPEELEPKIRGEIDQLSENLQSGCYTSQPFQQVQIPKFNEQNEFRTLALPAVLDKVVQHAAVALMTPIYEPLFLDCSYAYRPQKGPIRAVKRVEHILNHQKVRWAAPCDIDNCFDSFRHDRMMALLAEQFEDTRWLDLFNQWITTGHITRKGDFLDPQEGISQGSVISPLLSNIYLHEIDTFVVNEKIPYVRYSDNFITFYYDKEKAYVGRERIQSHLEERLGLMLNPDAAPFQHVEGGFTFLGIYFKGTERNISREKITKTFRRLNALTEAGQSASPDEVLGRINEYVRSHRRFYQEVNPVRQFAEFDQHLLKRVRFLLISYREKGGLATLSEMTSFLDRLELYGTYESSARREMLKKCIQEIKNRPQPSSQTVTEGQTSKTAPPSKASRGRMAHTQVDRVLKRVGDQSDVVLSNPGLFIGKTANRMVLKSFRKKIHEQHFSAIRQITVAAKGISFSSDVIEMCARQRIPVAFFGKEGKPLAIIHVPQQPDADLSIQQSRLVDSRRSMDIIRKILTAKCRNQTNIIKFYARHRAKTDPLFERLISETLPKMQSHIDALQNITFQEPFSLVRTRFFTTEAHASGCYWEVVKHLLPPELGFVKREKQGATDVVNSMLNYGYGILYQRIWWAVHSVGLNPNISFLHGTQHDRPTFVFDMIEEFRQPFVDRPIFSLMTRGTRYTRFKNEPDGLMDKFTRDAVIKTILQRLSSLAVFREKKVRAEEILRMQMKQMAEVITGKRKNYMAFVSTY
jgi:group II intron reverse transcriptase/maturase/CRISPR-associated endonuclease Cas1